LDLRIPKKRSCQETRIRIKTYNAILEDPSKRVKDATIFKLAKALDFEPGEIVILTGQDSA
jgi:hypothetical protein